MGADPIPHLESTFVHELPGMSEAWTADEVSDPRPLIVNDDLAVDLGIDPEWLRSPEGTRFLVGNHVVPGSVPVAQAYSGHQFGSFSPLLGDGRALLLGEIIDASGHRRDLHLKGSGRTRFSRGGDGKAALGPMLREFLMGEAMYALGIPTTRALAVVATGAEVRRDEMLPGAVLCRVASSHLRVGSFEYAARLGTEHLRRLVRYSIERHDPCLTDREDRTLAFLGGVVARQSDLVARWMLVGFIHGVMNTDNMTLSGETIDYGPCAFMDAYDPGTVFSSIDSGRRYAFGNQPRIAQWNLARLAETLLPLIAEESGGEERAVELATEVVHGFTELFEARWLSGMRAKTGLVESAPAGLDFFAALLELLRSGRVDHTNAMRSLSSVVRGDSESARSLFPDPAGFDAWCGRWKEMRSGDTRSEIEVADSMDRVNPAYIPRNHQVEIALHAARAGDLSPMQNLLDVIADPFTQRGGLETYAEPMPSDWEGYQTFCGT